MTNLIQEFGNQPIWGVCVSFASEAFYDRMTYKDAVLFAQKAVAKSVRRATVVLCVGEFEPEAEIQ